MTRLNHWVLLLLLGSMGLLSPALLATVQAGPQPIRPLAKRGGCPSDYSSWDNYCIPTPSARGAFERIGAYCPQGFESSGAYCVAYPNGREAILKIGYSCPPTWENSGNYCLSP
jgi:hypothetical protein